MTRASSSGMGTSSYADTPKSGIAGGCRSVAACEKVVSWSRLFKKASVSRKSAGARNGDGAATSADAHAAPSGRESSGARKRTSLVPATVASSAAPGKPVSVAVSPGFRSVGAPRIAPGSGGRAAPAP